ncbi:unnamed protein product [Caenorhabditis sp. 36 PRJEB53466]|nr:unnamed protein product [Caenorhabditis sp. 36 PRJEB53466]
MKVRLVVFAVVLIGAFYLTHIISVGHYNRHEKTLPKDNIRFKRDGGWSEYVQKMSTVSCISSGISLLYGLINGHIAMDKAVAELLNFGSVKVSDVAAINKDSVNAWTNDLKAPGLDGTKDALDLEEHTVGLARMKVEMTDRLFGEVPDKATYFSVIDNFVNDPNMDFKNLTDAGKIITNTIKLLNNVTGQPEVTNENYGDILSFFIKIVKGLTNVEGVVSAASTISSKSTSYNTLKDENHPLIPLANFIYFAEKTKLPTPLGTSGRSEVIKNLDIVSKLSTQSAKSKSTVSHVNSLLFCRLNPLKNSRKYAPGLVLGLSDLSNLPNATRDHLVEKTVGGGKNFARFGDGFKPVMELTDKLQPVDGKLRKVATQENLASIRKIVEIQRALEDASVGKQEAEAVFDEFRTIRLPILNPVYFSEIKKLMEEVNNLRNAFTSIDTFASKSMTFDGLSQLKQTATLPSKIDADDVKEKMNAVKAAKDTVETVIKSLKAAKEIFERLEQASQAKTLAKEIKSKKAKVDGFYDQSEMKTQLTALNNLKDAKQPSEKVSKAIQAAQKIRALAPSDVTNFEWVVSAVSSVAPTLKNLPTVLEDMKKKQSDVVKDLMGMKGAKDVAEKIGKPTAMVRNMQELQRVDISVLKDVSHVTTALRNVSDLGARAEIEKKWGDHSKDIASIESTLQQINTFKTTVQSAQPKDLREIGAPLASARNVGSLSVTAAAKSDALSILIPFAADPKVLEDLRQKKEKLDELAALDLDFAAYHSSIAAVPLALTSLFDFLTSFLEPKKSTEASGDGGDWTGLVCGILGVVALLVILAVGGFFLRRYRINRKKKWAKVREWIRLATFERVDQAVAYIQTIKTVISKSQQPKKLKGKAAAKTRLILPDRRFVDANAVNLEGGGRMIMTSDPTDAHTIDDLLYMVTVCQVEYIVQLSNFFDEITLQYVPGKIGRKKTFGDYEVTLKDAKEADVQKVDERDLVIRNKKTDETWQVTHLHVRSFKKRDGERQDPRKTVALVRKVLAGKEPRVLVHCPDGLRYSGQFVGVAFVGRLAERRTDLPPVEMFVRLHRARPGIFPFAHDIYYTLIATQLFLIQEYGDEALNDPSVIWTKLDERYRKSLDSFDEIREKGDDHELDEFGDDDEEEKEVEQAQRKSYAPSKPGDKVKSTKRKARPQAVPIAHRIIAV